MRGLKAKRMVCTFRPNLHKAKAVLHVDVKHTHGVTRLTIFDKDDVNSKVKVFCTQLGLDKEVCKSLKDYVLGQLK